MASLCSALQILLRTYTLNIRPAIHSAWYVAKPQAQFKDETKDIKSFKGALILIKT